MNNALGVCVRGRQWRMNAGGLRGAKRLACRHMSRLHAGSGVVATGRKMLGETNPANSAPGTIRGDFCVDIGRCCTQLAARCSTLPWDRRPHNLSQSLHADSHI